MQSTRRFFSILAAVALACAAAVSTTAIAVRDRVSAFVRPHAEALAHAFREPRHLPRPAVALVQACAYVARQVKRARPTVTPRWRMCPSA